LQLFHALPLTLRRASRGPLAWDAPCLTRPPRTLPTPARRTPIGLQGSSRPTRRTSGRNTPCGIPVILEFRKVCSELRPRHGLVDASPLGDLGPELLARRRAVSSPRAFQLQTSVCARCLRRCAHPFPACGFRSTRLDRTVWCQNTHTHGPGNPDLPGFQYEASPQPGAHIEV